MLERLRRLYRKIAASSDDEPESFDHPRPQRINPDPPRNDWYARVRARSLRAQAAADTKALDVLDAYEPALSREASRQADELVAKVGLPKPRTDS